MSDLFFGARLSPEGTLLWTSSGWVIALAVLAALVSLGLSVWSGRRSPTRVWEALLLAPALLIVAALLAGPVWLEESGHTEAPRTVVLIDDSRSMGVLESGIPRHSMVEQALSRVEGETDLYLFGRELSGGATPTFDQAATDLGGALLSVADRYTGERLAGIVVITDGLDRGGMRETWAKGGGLALPELPGPLTLYQIGSESAATDVAVTEVETGGFAFVRTPFTLTANLVGSGYPGWEVPVTLSRDGKVIATQKVTLNEEGKGRVWFQITPKDEGRFSYAVAAPVWEGDAVPANNEMHVAVRVVRDRMRILQVCGSPSFDQKFLRLFLKQDPAVDLVSFFILRTNEDMNAGYHQSELSLIPFPYEELFEAELSSFDVVIFQNFDYAPFFQERSEELLGNIAQYVSQQGKAFVMMGGDRSFDMGGYADSPLKDVLPVALGVSGSGVELTSFQPSLTEAGAAHPVTRLLGDAAENQALWSRLSPLDGLNLSAGLAPGSAALLTHPTLKTPQGTPMPVVAVREAGLGRTMALMGDSSWRWVMTEAARGHGNQAYLRFWKNALRWLIKDPEALPVQVETARENYRVGDAVRVVIRAKDVGFGAMEGASISGEITGGAEPIPLNATTDEFGEAVLEIPVDARGSYRIKVSGRTPQGAALGQAQTVFAVTERDPELEEIPADARFLEALAAAVGGVHYRPGDYGAPLFDEEAGRRVLDRVETPLWRAPGLLFLAGLLASISWILRRRGGSR